MRPSQGMLIFMVFVAYWLFFWRGRAGLTAVALSLASLLLLWAMPVVALTGKLQTLWGFMLHEANWRQHLTLAGSRVIGAVGAIGVLAVALASVDALRAFRPSAEAFKPALLCLMVSGVILVAFLHHPVKMNYLLLAMPFGLLGVSLLCRPALVAFLCLTLIAHNGVGVPSLGRISTRYEMRPVGWGIAVRDYQERSAFPHQVENVVAQAPPHSVVGVQESTVWLLAYQTLTGQRAGWRVENPNEVIDAATQRRFVLMGDAASAERWRQQAHPVYITSGVAIRLRNSFNYDSHKAGFRVIHTVNVGL
ncbi:MAG: hypothetical protein N2651_04420 [Fimbriimonadales bacterium]|nr:hypothetical protein [Fimbriimonadales bacterium]